MSRPWFRRWIGFSRIPITWQGWAATALMFALTIPFGLLFVNVAEARPLLGWASGIISAAVALAFFVLVEWKLERDYGS